MRWTENPFPIGDQLRAHSPVVHSRRFLGCYLPTTYAAVKEIAYDTEHFSSCRVIVRDIRPQVIPSPPITSGPPEHKPAKQLRLPLFTPEATKKLAPRLRASGPRRSSQDAAVPPARPQTGLRLGVAVVG